MISSKKIILLVLTLIVLAGAVVWFLSWRQIIKPLSFIGPKTVVTEVGVLKYIDGLTAADRKMLEKTEIMTGLLKMQRACDGYKNDATMQSDCQSNLELNQVLIVKKAELCGYIQKKDDCYSAFAAISKDRALCDKVGDQKKQNDCRLNFDLLQKTFSGQSLDECRFLTETTLKDKCIFTYIGQQTDLKICDDPLITTMSTNGNTRCQNTILYNQALKNKDKSICEKITESLIKQSCQLFFTQNNTQ